jgi:hypothetical protein
MNVARWSESDIQRCLKQKFEKTRKAKKEAKAVEVQLPTRGKDGKFVRGPIPLDWIQAAIPCGRKSLNVVFALWFLAGFGRTNPVSLTAATLSQFGITAQSARRILQRLELAGLVTVDRKRGRSPIVTILPVGGVDHPDSEKTIFENRL